MTKKKKLIIVSGGSRGLGLGIIQHLLKLDYKVASFSRKKTDEISALQKHAKDNFFWEDIDATDSVSLKKWIDYLYELNGHIYGLINNAAIAFDGVITLVPQEVMARLINVNLTSVLFLTQACINPMLVQNSGVIINISSIIGSHGYSGLSAYSATKAGLDGVTRSLARELGQKNIRVNSVAPGYLETEMSHGLSAQQREQIIRRTPLGRLGKVNDIVGMIEFLLSDSAAFITGQILTIDGGITC